VELFEQIRREHAYGVGTIQGVAKKLGVHRRMVRECRVALNQRRLSFTLVKKATSDICVKEACLLCTNMLLERSAPQKGNEILLALFPRGFFCSLPELL
jgi:hypothetical protein